MRSLQIFALSIVVSCLVGSVGTVASAQRPRAARLFAEAERLAENGNHVAAAGKYEEAYELVPATIALVLATSERLEAGQWELAAERLGRLELERSDPEVAEFLPGAYAAMLGARTRLLIRCEVRCRVSVDGRDAEASPIVERSIWLAPDVDHLVRATFEDGRSDERTIRVGAGERMVAFTPERTVVVRPSRATQDASGEDDEVGLRLDDVLSSDTSVRTRRRRVAFTVLGAALALDGAAIASTIDASRARAEYVREADVTSWTEALHAQRRTQILAGAAVAATTSASIALAVVSLRRSRITAGVSVGASSLGAAAHGTF